MLIPIWPTPPNVHACTLTKGETLSLLPTDVHVRLLDEVHGHTVITFPTQDEMLKADGVYTRHQKFACSITTADCLAVLLCDLQGTEVAALHAGWRGLAQNIIARGVEKFHSTQDNIIAWLSPAICPKHYEVDAPVYDAFVTKTPELAACFEPNRQDHWRADLYAIARFQLAQLGVTQVFGGDHCTFEQEALFYSHRRAPENKARLIHTIWLE